MVSEAPPPPSLASTSVFRPTFYWHPLPPSWQMVYQEGKLVAWALNPNNSSVLVQRDDVLLRHCTDDDGAPAVAIKAKPISSPPSTTSKRFIPATLEAIGFLLQQDCLNPEGTAKVDKTEESTTLLLSPSTYFPGDPPAKSLDVPSALHKAQDQSTHPTKMVPLPSLPISYPPSAGLPKLRSFLRPAYTAPPPS